MRSILGLLRGLPLIFPTIVYYFDYKHFELTLWVVMMLFLVIHSVLVIIAIIDLDCKRTVTQDPITTGQKKPSERCEETNIQMQKPDCYEEFVRYEYAFQQELLLSNSQNREHQKYLRNVIVLREISR